MTWRFLCVTGLKAQLALPRVSFIKQCQRRLIDIICGQVSLIYDVKFLGEPKLHSQQKKPLTHCMFD